MYFPAELDSSVSGYKREVKYAKHVSNGTLRFRWEHGVTLASRVEK